MSTTTTLIFAPRIRGRRRHILAWTALVALTAACGGAAADEQVLATTTSSGLTSSSTVASTALPTGAPSSATVKIATPSTTAPVQAPRAADDGSSTSASDSREDAYRPPTTEAVDDAAAESGSVEGGIAPAPGGSTGSAGATTTAPGARTAAVNVRQSSLGALLADGENHTIYASTADPASGSTCTESCSAQWIPIKGEALRYGPGVDPALLATFIRADNTVQLSYAGRPLYRLHNEPVGEIMGQGNAATWFVVSPSGALIRT